MTVGQPDGNVIRDTRRTILIVDDDPEILTVVARMLSTQGYHIVLARDGEEALQKARAEKPDAVLLDIVMPGLDGLTVLERLRGEESVAHTPVGFLTARDDLETYERARNLGGHIYLMKPFSTEKLLTFVSLLLGGGDERTQQSQSRPG